ncbi:MAG TPA: hypothetical protein VFQ00_10940 [Terriglobales bacterium]|nr:hypothetical protein [Terriglobales bacterium]
MPLCCDFRAVVVRAAVVVGAIALLSYSVHSDAMAQLPPAASAPLPAVEIVRRAMQQDVRDWAQEKDYNYLEHIQERELGADGRVTSQKSQTDEILVLYDEPYTHLLRRNDQPLSSDEAQKIQQKFDETTAKRSHETPEERTQRLAEFSKRHEEQHAFLLEVPDAYTFRLLGQETVAGRAAYVIAGEPRPDFRPKLNAARVLPKLRLKLWIAQDGKGGYEWLKVEAGVIDTITWGGFLLRLHPGSHIELEQTLVNNEVWLPLHAHLAFDARVALIKPVRAEVDVQFSDYKKFRAESRIVSVKEPKP